MNNSLNIRIIEAATRMIEYLDKAFETTIRLERDNASRIVWIVAISGFILINLPIFTSKRLPLIYYLPWIITAILGIVTHWLYRSVSVHDLQLYTTKREQLMAFILNGPENATLDDLNKIVSNKTPQLIAEGKDLHRTTTLTWILETSTVVLLVISFGLIIYWVTNYP
jgi:hypothetical protein